MWNLIAGLFDSNEKQINKTKDIIAKINSYEEDLKKLTDEQLRDKTKEFRDRIGYNPVMARRVFSELSDIELSKVLAKEKSILSEILPEAFAVVREASRRVTNHRHYDVQMVAGYFIFENKIIELFTGEGKTLAANLAIYLYGLTGRGAHLVTVNDYLARRDAEWNGHVLNSLGITVGAINNNTQYKFISDEEALKLKDDASEIMKIRDEKESKAGSLKYDHMSGVNLIECSKKDAYACDVVYGTNNEFGFDYLRDNMAGTVDEIVQSPLYFAVIDEADSILIDEARTPLIISTSAQASNDMYKTFASLVKQLNKETDYVTDEKSKSVSLSDAGIDKIEKALKVKNIYEDAQLAYHLDNALKAKEHYLLDKEYIVREGKVMIVDEFTGRVLDGRRYSEGLHQAIEAKEGVEVNKESRTMATVTLQNYFRMYKYLAGMTGTALTEAEEFAKIYKLDVVVVPTNRPVVREDFNDTVYRSEKAKFKAIIEDIKEHHKKGQPVLVGTTSVENSEVLSTMLSKDGIEHNVLNAKQHEKEAHVVSQAGQKGMVTIATNMAGRGTDISLGAGVKEVGGLYIIGSERHESRRIDNQLRGRAGRQGDPGSSRFYISFEDELMRLFGGDRMNMVISSLGVNDDMPISLGILGRTIESAQKKVEAYNYDIRKSLVEYDDVLNKQRDIIYGIRRKILYVYNNTPIDKESINEEFKIEDILKHDIEDLERKLDGFSLANPDTWNLEELNNKYQLYSPLIYWVLKKIFIFTRDTVSTQLTDDMQIDNVEERKIFLTVKAILSDDLFEVSIKLLGFETYEAYFREYDKQKNVSDKLNMILRLIYVAYRFHINAIGILPANEVSKALTLQTIDNFWMEHLDGMSDLREGIGLRNLAQKDPLVEYKNEGFNLFNTMMISIDDAIVSRFFRVRMVKEEKVKQQEVKMNNPEITTQMQGGKKIGRNDLCPCGSGKKYKKCHYPQFG